MQKGGVIQSGAGYAKLKNIRLDDIHRYIRHVFRVYAPHFTKRDASGIRLDSQNILNRTLSN